MAKKRFFSLQLAPDGARPLPAARRRTRARVGAAILLALLLVIFIAPLFVPYGYAQIITVDGQRDRGAKNLGPFQYSQMEQEAMARGERIFPHIFGTDELCRDYFVRVLYGARVSLLTGVFATLVVLIIGTIYGAIAGYAGGRADLLMMRVVDLIYALPDTLMVILFSVALGETLMVALEGTALARLGSNLLSLFIVFGALYWVGMARLVRARVLSLKKDEYVLAARSLGASPVRILRRHILPGCVPVMLAAAAMQVPSAIFTESFLSFIGLGVQAPMPSLGSLANAARGAMGSYPHKLVFPAAVLCLIVLAFNLISEGSQGALDPRAGGDGHD